MHGEHLVVVLWCRHHLLDVVGERCSLAAQKGLTAQRRSLVPPIDKLAALAIQAERQARQLAHALVGDASAARSAGSLWQSTSAGRNA